MRTSLRLIVHYYPKMLQTAAAALPKRLMNPGLARTPGRRRSDVDASTLDGKVLCGYRGWFNTPGDGQAWLHALGQGLNRPKGADSRSTCGRTFRNMTRMI